MKNDEYELTQKMMWLNDITLNIFIRHFVIFSQNALHPFSNHFFHKYNLQQFFNFSHSVLPSSNLNKFRLLGF